MGKDEKKDWWHDGEADSMYINVQQGLEMANAWRWWTTCQKNKSYLYFEDDKKVLHIQMSLDFMGFEVTVMNYETLVQHGMHPHVFLVCCKIVRCSFQIGAKPVGFRISKNEAIKYSLHINDFHVSKVGCPEIEFDKSIWENKMMMEFCWWFLEKTYENAVLNLKCNLERPKKGGYRFWGKIPSKFSRREKPCASICGYLMLKKKHPRCEGSFVRMPQGLMFGVFHWA